MLLNIEKISSLKKRFTGYPQKVIFLISIFLLIQLSWTALPEKQPLKPIPEEKNPFVSLARLVLRFPDAGVKQPALKSDALPDGGIHHQITQNWRNSVTTWR